MTETPINPETGKPNPVSVREYYLMDRYEREAFRQQLTTSESNDFSYAAMVAVFDLPQAERTQLALQKVAKLENRPNTSIKDKLEVALAKWAVTKEKLPKKPPILLRKFRNGQGSEAMPKWLREKKSPYLMKPPVPVAR